MNITTVFMDIGGVILTNGWDHNMRKLAAWTFDLDYDELNERHHLTFGTYEEGKLSLEQYLERTIFYRERPFSKDDFRKFMYAQSKPFPDMLLLMRSLKLKYKLKMTAISNEGRELSIYRVQKFRLNSLIDIFISSAFVHFRKPDEDIYRMALDISQASPDEVLYIDDREMFVQVARGMGIRGIIQKDYKNTVLELGKHGLTPD
ncbi:MAG: HAD family phosphatase [Syntrophaceae bacterium]